MQITNCRSALWRAVGLVEQAFDLEFLLADTVRFIPMDLGLCYSTIWQAHCCSAFELLPPAEAINLLKASQFPDLLAYGDALYVGDFPDHLSFHRCSRNKHALPRYFHTAKRKPELAQSGRVPASSSP